MIQTTICAQSRLENGKPIEGENSEEKKVLLDAENEGGLLLSKCGWDLKSFSCHQQFEKVSKKFAN